MAVGGGNVKLSGGLIRDLTYAVNLANALSLVDVDDVTFGANVAVPIQITTPPNASGGLFIRPTRSTSLIDTMVPSGAVTLPFSCEVIRVTGPGGLRLSNINTFAWPGRRIIFVFETTGMVVQTARGSNLKTKAGADVSFGIGATFQFVWDPGLGYWLEV